MSNIQKTKFTNSNGDNLIILPDTDSANNGDVLTVTKSGQTASIVWAESGGGGTTDISIDKCIFVDPENGSDTNSGLTEDKPVATVAQAYTLMELNDFDTFCVIGTEPNDPQENPVLVEIPAVPDTLEIDTLNIVTKISSQLTFASINKALNINAKSSVLKVFYGGTVTSNINITSDGNVEMHNTEDSVESTTSNLKINVKGDVFLNCIPYEDGEYGYYADSSADYYDFYAQSVNVKANNIYACGCVKNGCDITFIADNDVYNAFTLSYEDSQAIGESDSNWANVTQNYYLEAGNRVCQLEGVVANTFIVKSKYYGYYDSSDVVTGSLTVKSRVDIRTTNDTYIGSIDIGDITERGHVYIVGGFEQCISDKALFDQQGNSLNNPILQINGIISHHGITADRNLYEYAPIVFIDWKGLIEHNDTAIYAQQYKEKSLGYAESSSSYSLYISGIDYFDNDTPVYQNYPVEIYSEGTLRKFNIYTGIDETSQKLIPVYIKCKTLVSDHIIISSHDISVEAENITNISPSIDAYFILKPAGIYNNDGSNQYLPIPNWNNKTIESKATIKAKRNITMIPSSLDDSITCNQIFNIIAGEEVKLLNVQGFGDSIRAKIINIKARKLSGNCIQWATEFHVDVDEYERTYSYFNICGWHGDSNNWANISPTQSTFNIKTVKTEATNGLENGMFSLDMDSQYPLAIRNVDIHIDTIICNFDWSQGIICPIFRQCSYYKGTVVTDIGCIINVYGLNDVTVKNCYVADPMQGYKISSAGLQAVTKTASVNSNIASVTLDNDKYNIIETIGPSATTGLNINIPSSVTKVQECGFEFGVCNDSLLSTVNAYMGGRQLPIKAPTAFDSTKLYQGTSLNGAIIIAEFDYYPIVITNAEATNETSSSIDIVVTGTMGINPLPNNLEYILALSMDGITTNINTIGTTTTLTGADFDNYSNATEVLCDIIIDSRVYGEFSVKADPYNPLGLPAYTIRVKYKPNTEPDSSKINNYATKTQVDATENIWDVTYENPMWNYLFSSQNNLLEVIGANTSDVTSFSYVEGSVYGCFDSCGSLTSVALFDTSNATNMAGMFKNCTSLTTVPLFDTSSVTNMSQMFNGCSTLTTVPLFNTMNVTDMSYMFCKCLALTTVPLFDTSSVTNMSQMFNGCSTLTTVPLFDTSSVTNMSQMFYACSALTTLPLFDTSKVTNFSYTFNKCSALTNVPLFNLTAAIDIRQMFYDCTNVESGALALYQAASDKSWASSSYYRGAFYNCGVNTTTGAAELAQIPSTWK